MFLNRLAARLKRMPPARPRRGEAPAPASPDAAGPSDGPGRGLALRIVFSDVAWRMTLTGADGVAETRQGDLFQAIDGEGEGVAAGLRAALKALAPGERVTAESVELIPFAPEIALFDSRAVRALNPDLAAFRRTAVDLSGAPDCLFDLAPLPGGDERRLIAVSGLELPRRCISTLRELAPFLRRIAPGSAAWLTGAPLDRPTATLFLGAAQSQLVCFDPASAAVTARTAPVGLHRFVDLIAEANSLPRAEAAREMAARDMIGRAAAAGMDAPLAALVDLVHETADYIADSRLAEPPAALTLVGGHDAAKGLAGLLAKRLGMPVDLGDATPDPGPIAMNLLRSAEGPLFSEGSRAYRFVGDRFVAEEADARRTKATTGGGRKAAGGPQKQGGGRLGERFGDLSPTRLAAGGGVAALAALFLLYDQAVRPAAEAHARASARYADGLARSAALNEQVRLLRSTARRDALLAGAANKILWAEKFVSIADALPSTLWLTDAEVVNHDRKVGEVDVVATRLTLRGVSRAAGQRRLQDIALFIETLESDETFMRDFREITFAGLGGDADGAIFEVHAWYDENKRRAAAAKDRAADPGVNPLGAAQAAAAARQSFTPNLLGGQTR